MPALVLPDPPAVRAVASQVALAPRERGVLTQPHTLDASSQTSSGLKTRIEAVRLADDRFYGVRAEVRGNVVYLRGTVYCWDHLFELARSIARLPGVKQVLFADVREKSP